MATFAPGLFRSPLLKADAEAILFSAKTFAAAMLAYYIALRIGLPTPSWAIVTVYIVSQTSAGASLSRGVYRLVGTIVGAVATVAVVPNFANAPIMCSLVLAGWIGLCLYFSLLDRTPRAYGFVLAGYTASLIGFPAVLDPGAIFETAAVRVQEISLGILCAVLAHRYVLPRRMTGQFIGKLSATLRDAGRLAADALNGAPGDKTRDDRRQLAADLLALQGLATHLPYDPAPATPRREKLRLIHDRLARLLPLATEIEARIHALGDQGDDGSESVRGLLDDLAVWIATVDAAEPGSVAVVNLIDRARSLQTQIEAADQTSGDSIVANLCGHLAEMIGLLQDCVRLGRDITAADRAHHAESLHWPVRAQGYVYHRDPWMAGRAALGAGVGILVGCLLWIWSAWPEGGMAVSILGVCCTLFGNVDAPAPNLMRYMVGSIYGVLIALAYAFVILPRISDFGVLVAVLAPAFLFAGSLQARLPTALMALGMTLTLPILAGLSARYSGDFAASVNTVVALFVAIGFGVVSISLFQTVPVDAAIGRLLRVSRTDVRRRALGVGPDEARWTSLMVDRTALLFPRLEVSQNAYSEVLDDTLRHLRIGHAAGLLRKMALPAEGDIRHRVDEILATVAARFAAGSDMAPVEVVGLDRRIGCLMELIADSAVTDRSRLLNLLIDLRFAVGPVGPAQAEPRP